MEAAERIKLVRMIEKMHENAQFSRRIGMRDVSVFRKPEQKERAETL